MEPKTSPPDPEEVEAGGAPAAGLIDPGTTMGAVHLTVSDLERSANFYRDSIGLALLDEGEGRAAFGVRAPSGPRELVVLEEVPGAGSARHYSGLYHFALLLPERRDLATWLAHAARKRIPTTGFADHFVSEALYLQDPDDHGIEIYRDRPRSHWEGLVADRMTTLPLDVDDLVSELADPATEPFDGLPGGTVMGHVHLRVARIPETVTFYRDLIGFGLMAQLGNQAAFLSAGGYHHHIGANTWESAGAGPAPDGSATLRHATVLLPGLEARHAVLGRLKAAGIGTEETPAGPMARDPSGNHLLLALA